MIPGKMVRWAGRIRRKVQKNTHKLLVGKSQLVTKLNKKKNTQVQVGG